MSRVFTLHLVLLLGVIMNAHATLFAQSSLDVKPGPTPKTTTQLIVVTSTEYKNTDAKLYCYSRENSDAQWRLDLGPIATKIGRGGLAPYGEMSEWGAMSPQGEYDLGYLFGVAPQAPEGCRLAYRQITTHDFWIDEAEDPNYNHWVSGEEPEASHERLILGDWRYDLVIPMHYNINPTVPKRGSAIFFHLWKDENTATGGCVAISRENMEAVLRWMDPKRRPRMRLGLESEMTLE